ncbi:hypothetical protein FRB94_009523 [Tulasnella sp. JGI-2019a]|nr:hypothetical protein FRB94_009523 [Tulasnella sp. JGI-2019a]
MYAPELRVCTTGPGGKGWEKPTVDLRGWMTPKLESLTISVVALRSWDSMVLVHLQRLALSDLCIQVQDLILALRECKTIVQLSLDHVFSSETGEPVLRKHPQAIFLGSLTDLCIKDMESQEIVALLAVSETPKCTSFLLGTCLLQFSDTFVPACIHYITPAANLAFASPSRIEFICDSLGLNLRVRCDDRTWQFKILDPTASKMITWVLSTFKDVLNRTPADVAFNSSWRDYVPLNYEPDILSLLPHIETIRVGPEIKPRLWTVLISALSQLQSGGDEEGRWLCPHLRHLHIEAGYTNAGALMGMLRNRKKSAGVVDALETLELPHENTLRIKTFKIERIVDLYVVHRSKAKQQEKETHQNIRVEA